jgi:hypothetical protein
VYAGFPAEIAFDIPNQMAPDQRCFAGLHPRESSLTPQSALPNDFLAHRHRAHGYRFEGEAKILDGETPGISFSEQRGTALSANPPNSFFAP